MSTSYREKVLADYRKKKAENHLSLNLLHPTAASIRDECAVVFEARYQKKDESVVRYLVGEKNNAAEYLIALKILKADKVKSLAMFLQGRTDDTGEKNIELLAWLINYEPRPYQFSYETTGATKQPVRKRHFLTGSSGGITKPIKRWYWVGLVFLLAIVGLSFFWLQIGAAGSESNQSDYKPDDPSKGCMFWAGDHFQQLPCSAKKGDTLIVGFNPDRLARFRKIMRPDTITSSCLGKVWYSKIDGKVEFFTADGFHPVHVERRLHPLTQYIIDKYAH